jgi:hypothetical protein
MQEKKIKNIFDLSLKLNCLNKDSCPAPEKFIFLDILIQVLKKKPDNKGFEYMMKKNEEFL